MLRIKTCGGSVRADKKFWISTNSFNFINNLNDKQASPGDPGAKLVGFTRSVESKDSELDETLTIEADGINVSQASLAASNDEQQTPESR